MKILISTKYARPSGVGPIRSQRGRLVGNHFNMLTRYAALSIGLLVVPAVAQGGRPEPTPPPAPEPIVEPDTPAKEAVKANEAEEVSKQTTPDEAGVTPITWSNEGIAAGRRPIKDEPVVLAFKDVKLEELIEFIALETGKVVMPVKLKSASSSRDTYNIVADKPMPRLEALDFIFTYLRMNDIGIIERPNVIFIGKIDEMTEQLGELEVVSAATTLAGRTDRGTLILKIFQVNNTGADQISQTITEFFPENWAKIQQDELSNQIMVLGDVGLCQQVESIIMDLDKQWLQPVIKTFRLQYADASEIETNILQLFEQTGGSSTSRTSGTTRGNRTNQRAAATTTSSDGVPEAELRLTVNQQQNTVTLQGETGTVDKISRLIKEEWDLPRPEGTSRLFVLNFTDPIKVKDLLTTVLGGGSSTSGSSSGRTGGQAAGSRADATAGIAGVYEIEAFPDRNALLVLAKTVESFSFIENMILKIDQPTDAGLPDVIALKYADAVSLAEELNILLAKSGGRVSLPRPASGLSAEGFAGSDDGINISGPDTSETGSDLQFPWGNASNADEQSPESSLIGKVRIMPIIRQNAIAILAPPSYREPMRKLIEEFDQPRRQVMLAVTIVEVDLGDDLTLGLKLGSNQTAGKGALVVGTAGIGIQPIDWLTNLLGNKQTNTLQLGAADLNVIIEALNTITNTRIIQEPRIFTADNQEAVFFSGKEYPVATGTVETGVAGAPQTSTTIDYKNIGVFLNVRPRITEEGAVDLTISVELSDTLGSVNVGNTTTEQFGRKQVTTNAILLHGQTIVIGGLLKEQETITRQRIPLLADIPIIGQLFTFTDESLTRSELIAFVTPTVVHRPTDNYTNFNIADLERLESVSRPLAEQLKDAQKIIDLNVHERVRNSHGSRLGSGPIPPDQSDTQTEIDAFQPVLIELTPHNGDEQ